MLLSFGTPTSQFNAQTLPKVAYQMTQDDMYFFENMVRLAACFIYPQWVGDYRNTKPIYDYIDNRENVEPGYRYRLLQQFNKARHLQPHIITYLNMSPVLPCGSETMEPLLFAYTVLKRADWQLSPFFPDGTVGRVIRNILIKQYGEHEHPKALGFFGSKGGSESGSNTLLIAGAVGLGLYFLMKKKK